MIGDLFQPTHMIIVLVIVLIVFGPGKLPELGAAFGKGIKEFKKGAAELSDDSSHASSAAAAPVAAAPVAAAPAAPIPSAPPAAMVAAPTVTAPVPAAEVLPPAATAPASSATAVAVAEPPAATAAPVKCSKCGTLNQAGYRFCAGCGTQLTQAAA